MSDELTERVMAEVFPFVTLTPPYKQTLIDRAEKAIALIRRDERRRIREALLSDVAIEEAVMAIAGLDLVTKHDHRTVAGAAIGGALFIAGIELEVVK